MLELRRKRGTITALGYVWLEWVDFDSSEGLTLKFAGTLVKIAGRRLNGERWFRSRNSGTISAQPREQVSQLLGIAQHSPRNDMHGEPSRRRSPALRPSLSSATVVGHAMVMLPESAEAKGLFALDAGRVRR
jgi:hypothetical protein